MDIVFALILHALGFLVSLYILKQTPYAFTYSSTTSRRIGLTSFLSFIPYISSTLLNLRYLAAKVAAFAAIKVELIKFEASFMSEQASQFLSVIGLLGEYCPPSKYKYSHPAHRLGCMHLELQGYNIHFQGCQFMRPFSSGSNIHRTEEILAEEDQLLPF